MKNNMNSPLHKRQGQDTDLKAQKKVFFEYLKTHTATASMVEYATGVKQKNICRFKREFEKAGLLWQVVEKRCELTGCEAWYLTTNPDLAPNHPKQLELF